jgi:hypothetical protein
VTLSGTRVTLRSPIELRNTSSFSIGEKDVEMFVERSLHVREHYEARGWPWPDGPGFALWSRRVEDPNKIAHNENAFGGCSTQEPVNHPSRELE